ncbi:MAG TPA: DinB family protein [Chloroflexia bacterium]|nr:DinB family protein [Chloroflexia bacterium]
MSSRFDRFTERAQRVLQLAQEEAQGLGHNYIGTEHLLLGLVRESDGVASRVLAGLGIELDRVRPAVEAAISRATYEVKGEIGLTPRSKRVIELAVDEARRLNHRYIGTEHLLLGLIREGEGIASGVIESLDVSLEMVREKVIEVITSVQGTTARESYSPSSPGSIPISTDEGTTGFDKFTERARKTLQLAHQEAQRFNHDYIGTEHILLGLLHEGDDVAGRVLNNLGIDLHKVRSSVEFIIGRGKRRVLGELGLTPRAKRVIELAVDESRRLKHNYIGTEHLLLGLIREGEGIAAGVLESLGVSLDRVRREVIKTLNDPQSITQVPQEGAIRHRSASLDMLRTLFDYSIWARDKMLAAIETLEESQLRDVEKTGVYGSIYDTLAHLAVSEWLWLQRCMGESPLKLPKGEDFAGLSALVDWWNDTHAEAVQYLNSITEGDLSRELTYMAPDGKERTRKMWHMLLQIPNHQTEHRAQIGTMLGQLGVEVPPTDLVVYLSERA